MQVTIRAKMAKCAVSAACALLAAAFSGCGTPPPVDSRVTIAADVAGDVVVSDIRCPRNQSGFMTLQANVVNVRSGDRGVEWKVVWLDADGVEIDSLVSSWNKVMLAPNEIKGLKSTAPRPDAADMRFYLRRLR